MRAYERLLKYARVYTTSDPNSGTHPSAELPTRRQGLLAGYVLLREPGRPSGCRRLYKGWSGNHVQAKQR